MTVIINDPCECTYISNTEYHCNVPDADHFVSVAHLLKEDISVVMVESVGDRSIVAYNAFTVKVQLDAAYIKAWINWMKDHPGITAGVAIGAGVVLLMCCLCCWRERRKARYGGFHH